MAKILAVSGKIGSGKDTFTDYVKNALAINGYTFEHRYFAEKLKKVCLDITGYPGYSQEEKNVFMEEFGMTVGEALQKIGDGMREFFHQSVWVISAMKGGEISRDKHIILVTDCRYPSEVEYIKSKQGVVVRLEGDPAGVRAQSKRDLNHRSETALDDYQGFDAIYLNDKPLKDLQNFAEKIVEDFCC